MVIGITAPSRPAIVERVCRGCGGILDAPRQDPATGLQSRKCAGCRSWYPCEATSASARDEMAGRSRDELEMAS